MATPPPSALLITGNYNPTSRAANLTRVCGTTGPVTQFVEFSTKGAEKFGFSPAGLSLYQPIHIYLPADTPLYFSAYPPPTPLTLPINVGPIHPIIKPGQPTLTGADGAPVTITNDSAGIVNGLTGVVGSITYSLEIKTTLTPNVVGRLPNTKSTWQGAWAVFTTMDAASRTNSKLILALSYCAADNLMTLTFAQDAVISNLVIDLSFAGEPGAHLTRSVAYYKVPFVTQKRSLAGAVAPDMLLADSALHHGIGMLEWFAPALAYLAGDLNVPSMDPVRAQLIVAGMSPSDHEVEAAYVTRAVADAGPAIPSLAQSLAPTTSHGLSDAVRLLGWAMIEGPGKSDFGALFANQYESYSEWLKANQAKGPRKNFVPKLSMRSADDDGPAMDAINSLFNKAGFVTPGA